MTLGAFISSGTAGVVASKFGRKQCLWAACLLCCVSNIIMMATENIGALYAGRFLIGVANGYFMTFSQLYIQESSPARYRGWFLTIFQFFTSFGTLVGTIIDWATAKRPDKSAYLIPLGMIYIVPVFLTVALFFIPESPRWLILQNKHDEGTAALRWIRPAGSDVVAEANEIRAAIDRERELGSSVGIRDMFTNPVDRRRTVLAVCAVTLQAASGSMFVIAYKAYFLTMAAVPDPFAMSNVLSVMGILAILFNSLIVVRFGRRRVILMTGLAICGCLQLIIAVVYDKLGRTKTTGNVLVALTCLYMMSYNGMIASYAWLAGGEIPSQRLRSYTFGLAAAVGFLAAWVTTFTAPYFINPASMNWGPKYGYIWAPSCAIAVLWVLIFLPETKGRTLEEIDEMVRVDPAFFFVEELLTACSLRRGFQLAGSASTCALVTLPMLPRAMRDRRRRPSRRAKRYFPLPSAWRQTKTDTTTERQRGASRRAEDLGLFLLLLLLGMGHVLSALGVMDREDTDTGEIPL